MRPTSLHEAAKAGDSTALAELLAEDGADVNARDGRGITPLGVAVGFNRLPVSAVSRLSGVVREFPRSIL